MPMYFFQVPEKHIWKLCRPQECLAAADRHNHCREALMWFKIHSVGTFSLGHLAQFIGLMGLWGRSCVLHLIFIQCPGFPSEINGGLIDLINHHLATLRRLFTGGPWDISSWGETCSIHSDSNKELEALPDAMMHEARQWLHFSTLTRNISPPNEMMKVIST